MNMHSFTGMSADACGLFNTIFRAKAALSSTQDISYWWLKFFPACRATLPSLHAYLSVFSNITFVVILSPGEAVCHGFTMGKSQDWLFECFKQNLFLFVSVSEAKTGLVKTTASYSKRSWKWIENDLMLMWQNTDIKLLAAVYNVRGDFLRWEQLGGNNLQVRHNDWGYKGKLYQLVLSHYCHSDTL